MSNYPNIKTHNTLPKILRHRSQTMPRYSCSSEIRILGIWNEISPGKDHA